MITLQLLDLPLDADVANPQGRPLGTRDQLAARLGELLPGTQFDAEGRGAFRRGAYDIAFKMFGTDPPTALGVAFTAPEAFAAIGRIVDKTHWSVIDTDTKMFVDLKASRAAGKVVTLGSDPVAVSEVASGIDGGIPAAASLKGGAESMVAFTAAIDVAGQKVRKSLPRSTRLLLAALTGVVIASGGLWYANKLMDGRLAAKLPTSTLLNQQQDLNRIERYEDRVRRRAAIEPRIVEQFRGNRVVQQMLDVQLGERAYWNFVNGMFSTPDLLSDDKIWSRYKMPTFLPATFAQRQRDGYVFEFRGAGCEMTEPNWPECTAYAYIARPASKDSAEPVFALFSSDDKIHFSTRTVPTREDPTVTSGR